jgi:VWFA-related protein
MRAAIAFVCALAGHAGRAQQPAPLRAPDTAKTGVTAVLVDVVVRDRHGQPVRDLELSDFQVLEDGVPQTIGSFSRVFDGAVLARAPASGAEAAPASVRGGSQPDSAGPAVTALVFDRLNPDARRLAVRAAQDYLGTTRQPDYIGIFDIDLALTPYAPFTRNREVLQQALDRIASHASARFNAPDQHDDKASADQRAATAEEKVARVAAAGGAGAAQAMGSAPAEAIFAAMQSKMIQDFEVMERDQQGYSTTNGLFAIINTLQRVPGRKSLVFFSEGLAIPPAVQRLFRGVIDAANRASVSIYTMDAAGLRAESEQAKIRDEVNQSAGVGINTGYANTSGRNNNAPLTQRLEKNEDVLRQDPRTGLGELAQDTGGLAFDNTNNLRQGFERIESDQRNYYLIGYVPANDAFDGRFRVIDVKVTRPGVTVSARKGYFAVRDPGGALITSREALALAALEQKPVPNAFPIRAGALLFPERERPGLVPVIATIDTAALSFERAADGKTYASDFTVVVRFLDQRNQVARQVSQHYEVKGPLANLERAKQGEVIFYREPELPPGVYAMETVVYDAPSGKSSVRFSTVEVAPADTSRLRMSSLVVVRRSEKVAASERRHDNPLLVDDIIVYPNLGEPVSKASKEAGFYFAIYPGAGRTALEPEIFLSQNGRLLARLPMPLAAPDPSGRIAQLGRLPLDQLAPGTYELRVVVKQGAEQVSRSTMLRIVE